jgi:hypothetical protein
MGPGLLNTQTRAVRGRTHDPTLVAAPGDAFAARHSSLRAYLFLWRFARRFFFRLCFMIFLCRTFRPPAMFYLSFL